MEEIWKDIQGYEKRYQISNLGNVKSLCYRRSKESKLLVPKCNNSGRLWVELTINGNKKTWLIHRLVAVAFIPNPDELPEVNHLDENPKNNRVDNLEWCTKEYNIRAFRNNHPDFLKGRRKDLRKIFQITADGKIVKTWESARDVEIANRWSAFSIAECCRGKRRTAYGYIWQYANENISDREAAK